MSKNSYQNLGGVSETLLITLYLRAMESHRADALIRDEQAVTLVKKIKGDGLYDFDRIKALHLSEVNKLVVILRNMEFDRITRDFLVRHPQAVVVHIGCGLDTRFERVDNGQLEWYALDLPDIIELRRKLVGGESTRHHVLACSVLERAWLDKVGAHHPRTFLFLAEGVFMYFAEAQVRSLVLMLRDRFPGAELVFDALSPLHARRHNLQMFVSRLNLYVKWGLWHGQEIERWGDDIHMLDEWGFFDDRTPRLDPIQWLRPIEALARTLRIYHFQLGNAAGSKDLRYKGEEAL